MRSAVEEATTNERLLFLVDFDRFGCIVLPGRNSVFRAGFRRDVRPGSPISGPEALLRNIQSLFGAEDEVRCREGNHQRTLVV